MDKTTRKRIAWIKSIGITARQFAEATGNDPGTAYSWFRTARRPRRKYLEAILRVFPHWPG